MDLRVDIGRTEIEHKEQMKQHIEGDEEVNNEHFLSNLIPKILFGKGNVEILKTESQGERL